MSIWAYVGLPRQGKSYHAVKEQILPALRQGRRVVTNIPLVESELRKLGAVGEIWQLTNDDLSKEKAAETLKGIRAGDVIVLDEMWRYLPQGLQAKDLPPEWGALFAEHGHMIDEHGRMVQIIFVVQDLGNIAAFARKLIERTVVVTKLEVIGSKNRYRVDTYPGAVTGVQPPLSRRISEEFGKFDPRIFKCYVSRTKSEAKDGVEVNERGFSDRGSVLRNPAVRFGLPIAALLMVFGLWRAYVFFFPEPDLEAAPASGESRADDRPSVRSVPVRLAQSMRYRIAGIVRGDDDTQSLVLLDHCGDAPARWVPWYAAQCMVDTIGVVTCQWRGRRYEFHSAADECRLSDERRSSEIRWFPGDDSGSSEQVSILGG